ncbi:ankyrin repeat-containing protein [Tanacetum coccineum]
MAEPDTSSPKSTSASSSTENFRNLPIMSLRSKIVEKIMENRVTLIVGETGCEEIKVNGLDDGLIFKNINFAISTRKHICHLSISFDLRNQWKPCLDIPEKLPILYGLVIDWFINLAASGTLINRKQPDEHKHELTPWAEAKLAQRIAKSATWTVRPPANYFKMVVDYYKNATVDLNTRTCSCGQWQLSGLPCGHLIVVMRHLRQSSANQFAFSCFKTRFGGAFINEVSI